MTDDTRTELRRGIELFVRLAAKPGVFLAEAAVIHHKLVEPHRSGFLRSLAVGLVEPLEAGNPLPDDSAMPPLTTAQQLALSVLVGEPDRAVLSALCDCLIEMGHEYAAAVAEKARQEERERVIGHIDRLVNELTSRMRQYDYAGPNYELANIQAGPLAYLKGAVESGREPT